MLDDIYEQDTSFLECKHKHMMKSGAPLDNVGVLYRMVTYTIAWIHKHNSFQRAITLWFLVLSQFL